MVVRTFRSFGKMQDAVEIPDLVAVQRVSYDRFLQKDVAPQRGPIRVSKLCSGKSSPSKVTIRR